MVYILLATGDHYTDEKFRDLQIRDFGGLRSIRKFMLTSKKIDLDGMEFDADHQFDNIEKRNLLTNNMSWPIFSPKFMQIIAKFDLPYKAFTVNVHSMEKAKLPFTALQIPRKKGVVDLENSIFSADELFPETFNTVKKFEFNLPEDSEQLFRVFEKKNLLFVREELKTAIESAKLEGVRFIPAIEFDNTTLY